MKQSLLRVLQESESRLEWAVNGAVANGKPLALWVERRTPETLGEDNLAELSQIYLWVEILINKFLQGYGPLYKLSTGLLDCRVLENIWLCASGSWVVISDGHILESRTEVRRDKLVDTQSVGGIFKCSAQ